MSSQRACTELESLKPSHWCKLVLTGFLHWQPLLCADMGGAVILGFLSLGPRWEQNHFLIADTRAPSCAWHVWPKVSRLSLHINRLQ